VHSDTYFEVPAIPFVSEFDDQGVSTVWSRATRRLYLNPAEHYRDIELRNRAVNAEYFQNLPLDSPTSTQQSWLAAAYTLTTVFLPDRWIDNFRFTFQDSTFWPLLFTEQHDRVSAFLGAADRYRRYTGPPVRLTGYGPAASQNTLVFRAASSDDSHPGLTIFVCRHRSGRHLVRVLFDLRTILLPDFE